MCRDIIDNGNSTEGQIVRARWEDGTPAYTIKRFGVVNRYDLAEEFPAITLRKTAVKTAVDEMLWIWQRKSNNIRDLKGHIWDEWADGSGSIGKAYGYQMAKKYKFAQGEMDQVDNVIWQLRNSPQSRRIMTNIYNFDDLSERRAAINSQSGASWAVSAYFQKDASGNTIPSQTKIVKKAKKGKDLVLTIDSNIQTIAEKALNELCRSEERRVGKECRSRWSPYH